MTDGDEPDLFGGLATQPAAQPRTRVKSTRPPTVVAPVPEPAPAASVIDPSFLEPGVPDAEMPETPEHWFQSARLAEESAARATLYSGPCRGGPLDGKPLHHGTPLFTVAFRDGRPITWAGPATAEVSIADYQYAGGEWNYIESRGKA